MAIREFPDHPNLWGWVYFAADELKNGTADEKAEAIKLLDLGMQKATPEQKVQLEKLKRSIKPGSP
jgi:Zn-dependent oligopeptidase